MLRKYRTMLLPLALAAMFSLALLACGTTTDAVDSSPAVAPGSNVVAVEAPAVSPEAQTATTESESPLKATVTVMPGARSFSGLFYMWLLLLLPNWILRRKQSSFETKRWYESDYG